MPSPPLLAALFESPATWQLAASGQVAGHAAAAAVAAGGAGWRAAAHEPHPWWRVDFGRRLRFGGVVIAWPDGLTPRANVMEVSADAPPCRASPGSCRACDSPHRSPRGRRLIAATLANGDPLELNAIGNLLSRQTTPRPGERRHPAGCVWHPAEHSCGRPPNTVYVAPIGCGKCQVNRIGRPAGKHGNGIRGADWRKTQRAFPCASNQ
jgi:hypothetical protein